MAIVPTPAKEEVVDADRTKANAMLREQFLRFVANICQKSVEVQMYEQRVPLSCKFVAMQRNQAHIFVNDLMTPTGLVEHAALRMRDVISIAIPTEEVEAKSGEQRTSSRKC